MNSLIGIKVVPLFKIFLLNRDLNSLCKDSVIILIIILIRDLVFQNFWGNKIKDMIIIIQFICKLNDADGSNIENSLIII